MSNNGDDFEDEFDPSETEEFDDEQSSGDEDWDEYEDQSGNENLDDEESGETAPKKKSSIFNMLLIVGGALVVIGMVVMQMGKGGGSAPAPAPAPVAAATPAPAEHVPVGMLGSDAEMEKMAALAKHNAQSAETAATPSPAPIQVPAPTPAVAPEVVPVAVATPSVPETIPVATPKEVSNVPTPPLAGGKPAERSPLEKTPEKGPEKVAETPAPTPVLDATPVPVKEEESATRMPSAQDMMLKSTTPPDVTPAPAPTPSGNADTAALNMKMDTILSRLTALEGEMSALKQKPDAAAEVADLKSTVESLQKKVVTGSASSQPKASKKTAATEPQPAPTSALPLAEEEKPAPQILGTTDPEPEAHPVASSGTPVKKTAAKPVKVSTAWVLKGAQPGQATVAKLGESDSRTVHVGDSLPGIGRITAVEYFDGRWAVIGTQGRINQ